MIIVTGHIRVPPDKMEHLRPHMRAVLEATRREDGCILYAFGEDVLDPGLIRIVERWDNWQALAAHSQAAHIKAWVAAQKSAGGALERDILAHEAGEERRL
jgi:quinol monooxygenase YgiN